MLAVLLFEKGQKLCSIPQIMPKIMLAQSARAYFYAKGYSLCIFTHFYAKDYSLSFYTLLRKRL